MSNEIKNAAILGFEFEFLTNDEPLNIIKELSNYINKKVVIPYNVDKLNSNEIIYHTNFEATSNVFKIERDYSGGKNCYELITGPMEYNDARKTLILILEWIKNNAYTNDRCALHVNLSFDETKIKLNKDLKNLNILKYIINFNEDFIYEFFPNRKDSIYAKSLKNIFLNDIFYLNNNKNNFNNINFKIPKEKYYGINFSKIEKGYLELRYIGGANYEKKIKNILTIIDYFIIYTYNLINSDEKLTYNEIKFLNNLLNENEKIIQIYNDPLLLKIYYPDIKLMIDLKSHENIILTYWNFIKDDIINILFYSKPENYDFIINYDTDVSKLQVSNCIFERGKLYNIEIISCGGKGIFKNCSIYDCEFENSNFINCEIVNNNIIKNSKIEKTNIFKDNEIYNSYIHNDINSIFDGYMEDGVFRDGVIGKNAKFENVSIITKKNLTKNLENIFYKKKYPSVDLTMYKDKKIIIGKKKSDINFKLIR